MSESANKLLVDAINSDLNSSLLWVVDENFPGGDIQRVHSRERLSALTNRIDIQQMLLAGKIPTELSDFAFSGVAPGSVDALYFRVGKEKAIVHHVINRCAGLLLPGGKLVLVGGKNEGIKTYIKKAAAYLGGELHQHRGSNATVCAEIFRGEHIGDPLDDREYMGIARLASESPFGEAIEFFTKPGVYGWKKIDQGSSFLVETLTEFLKPQERSPATVVDLGCGYGYLSVMASMLLEAEIVATDNNFTAVDMCRKNFEHFGLNGRVELADCGDTIGQSFELVLCNPPFHQGFSVQGELTERFLRQARRLLAPSGTALFVVNSFIPLEKIAREYFARCDVLANNRQFKVVSLSA